MDLIGILWETGSGASSVLGGGDFLTPGGEGFDWGDIGANRRGQDQAIEALHAQGPHIATLFRMLMGGQ
jgi:hypothetical protein